MPSITPTDVVPFGYGEHQVRTLTIDGDPWFVAADVAALLEYRASPDMTRTLDPADRGTHPVRTPSGVQDMAVITESGIWTALLRRQTGRMVDAGLRDRVRAIQRWVTTVVLPSVRATGRYEVASAAPALPQDYETALAALLAEVRKRKAVTRELEAAAPKVEAFDALVAIDGRDYSLREAAQLLCRSGIVTGQNRLLRSLRELRWVDGGGQPYQQQVDAGRLTTRIMTYDHPKTGEPTLAKPQVRITAKGVTALHTLLSRAGAA